MITNSPLENAAEGCTPNPRRLLSEYPQFDWSSIGAKALSADDPGATAVIWGGHTFARRTKAAYGAAIWFSRAVGRREDGESNDE